MSGGLKAVKEMARNWLKLSEVSGKNLVQEN